MRLHKVNKHNAIQRRRYTLPSRQRGVVLFVSLVMLMILTILGVSSVQTTSLQEVMSRNSQDTNLAFQAAESALRDGESIVELMESTQLFDAATPGYYYEKAAGLTPNWRDVDWADDNPNSGGYVARDTPIVGVAAQPRYIVEHLKEVEETGGGLNQGNDGNDSGGGVTQIFRVTSYGVGGSPSARVMLQATYGKKF